MTTPNKAVTGGDKVPRVERKPELREELNGTIAREFIQCKDATGKIGSFLATGSNRQVSPTFDNLGELYSWANENDWLSEAGQRVYRPRGEAIANYMQDKYPNLI